MTNTYALTDFDVYNDADYDNFGGRGRRRRKTRRRLRKLKRRKKSSNPIMGRPPVFVRPSIKRSVPSKIKIRPRIIRGRPMKLPPIQVKGLPIISIRKPKPRVSAIKIKRAPIVKSKTPISHLIKTSRPAIIKKSLSKTSKAEAKQIETATQIEASKKAMKSDGKTSKIVKIVAIVGVIGVTGLGIYKFIQNKKLNDGHISASK